MLSSEGRLSLFSVELCGSEYRCIGPHYGSFLWGRRYVHFLRSAHLCCRGAAKCSVPRTAQHSDRFLYTCLPIGTRIRHVLTLTPKPQYCPNPQIPRTNSAWTCP